MASPRFIAVKRALVCRLLLILPVRGQKVKGIGPSPLEVLIRSREQEPAGPTDRTVVIHRLGRDLDTSLQEIQTQLMIPDIDHLILPLTTYRHCHNIQTGGHYLTITISTRPTDGLFT